MKIRNMATKTALEVMDTDVLIIEDDMATKQITVAEFREYLLSSGMNTAMKVMMNTTLDTIANAILAAKYIITETRVFSVAVTIIDNTGKIQMSFKDVETDTWLSVDDLLAILATTVEDNTEDSTEDEDVVEDTESPEGNDPATINEEDLVPDNEESGAEETPDIGDGTGNEDGTESDEGNTEPGGDVVQPDEPTDEPVDDPTEPTPDEPTTDTDEEVIIAADKLTVELIINDIAHTPSYTEIVADEADATKGVVNLYFTGLANNEIAGITHEHILLTMPATEEYAYETTVEADLFVNKVAYVTNIG